MMPPPIEPDIVKMRLAAKVGELCRYLLTDVEQKSGELIGHAPDGCKIAVVWRGAKVGTWVNVDVAGVAGQSLLALIRDVVCDGDYKKAYRWALRWLGEDPGPAPARLASVAQAQPGPPPKDTRKQWLAARPFAWSEPVGGYLMARGVQPALVTDRLGSLRYAPSLWNAELGTYCRAMVAAVLHPKTRKHLAIHRTYIAQDDGGWRKANVDKPKMVLGSYTGGVIPLTRGISGKAWSDAPEGDQLILAEGIENALIVAQQERAWRSAAYIAANNLTRIDLPECFHAVCLVIDRDGENFGIREDRELAIGRWQDEGREVSTWLPPEGVKDAADAWQLELAGGRPWP